MPKRRKKVEASTSEARDESPFNPAFSALSSLREAYGGRDTEAVPDVSPQPEPRELEVETPEDALAAAPRLVVRKEKKGRGGKTITRVEGFQAEAQALEVLARTIAKALGCGVSVSEQDLLIQGAQSHRVGDWLRQRGARRVIIGDSSK